MMQKWSDNQCRVNSNDIPAWLVLFNKFPCLLLRKCLASSVDKVSIRIANAFLPGGRVVIVLLHINMV